MKYRINFIKFADVFPQCEIHDHKSDHHAADIKHYDNEPYLFVSL